MLMLGFYVLCSILMFIRVLNSTDSVSNSLDCMCCMVAIGFALNQALVVFG